MRFLKKPTLPEPPSVLLVQTANPDLTMVVLKKLVERFGAKNTTLLFQRNMKSFLTIPSGVHIIENVKADRVDLVKKIRKMNFSLIATIASTDSGFWKLKLLPYVCTPRQIWIFDKNGQGGAKDWSGFLRGQFSTIAHYRSLTIFRRAFAPFIFAGLAVRYLLKK
jgi:hypothetical protein